MGLLDKARQRAAQARAKAEQVRQQSQAKVAEIRQNRAASALYRVLGEAVYAVQRHGGDPAAVDAAVAALDAHYATAAPDETDAPPRLDAPPGG